MALLLPTLDYSGFERVDLVIEAVVEKLEVKQEVFAETAAHVPAGAVLASNTSSLSIGAIGAKTPHRERVVGMHFFNPVHKMPLVEVIAPEGSRPGGGQHRLRLHPRLGKTPVLVKDSPGFLVNRLLMFYSTEALWLLDEGYRIEDLDRAMTDWGMPHGPDRADRRGGDRRGGQGGPHPGRRPSPTGCPCPPGSTAWASRAGWARRTAWASTATKGREAQGARTRRSTASWACSPASKTPTPAPLADRMVLPMVNEAARCLEEGVVGSAGRARPGADLRHRLPALPRRPLPLGGPAGAPHDRRHPGAAGERRRRPLPPLRGPARARRRGRVLRRGQRRLPCDDRQRLASCGR